MDKVFKKYKKSGSFHRRSKQKREKYVQLFKKLSSDINKTIKCPVIPQYEHHIECTDSEIEPHNSGSSDESISADEETSSIELNNQNSTFEADNDNALENYAAPEHQNGNFREALKSWAVQNNITHQALKGLLKLLNQQYQDARLPFDPRTLLETSQGTGKQCVDMAGGTYWHHGLKACLSQWFANVNDNISVSLNINIDGLPIYKSSKYQLWPILCNVHEMPQLKPLPVGIFLGKSKPSNVNEFLTPFVDELLPILEKGFVVNCHTVNVRVRCLICDSPARAFIKGVVNFNGKNGCLKCTIHGEYSYVSRTVVFPSLRCPLRTDEKFRQKKYGQHHTNQITPLLRIPTLDMIQDFVIADSLHLLDLGLMKRLLTGWRDGNFGFVGKLSALQVQQLSNVIVKVKLPKEFHRKIRSMDCLAFWKGTEWHTFLNYISIVVLKDFLNETLYNHFLLLFTAVTICSSDKHIGLRPLAQILFEKFIEEFKNIYGQEYITSNIHNLEHVVNDVRRFGSLYSISAYPFENYLSQLKKFVRQGNNCLEQVANRLLERNNASTNQTDTTNVVPGVSRHGNNVQVIIHDGFILNSAFENSWFLTKNNEIVKMVNASYNTNNDIVIHGCATTNRTDFFTLPIRSSNLFIYKVNISLLKKPKQYNLTDIVCKYVAISYKYGYFVFVPLLHTFK